MLKFLEYLISENIGDAKISVYVYDLLRFERLLGKEIDKSTKEDIRLAVSKLNRLDNLSEWTKRSTKIVIRKLYCFLKGYDKKGVYPDEVAWISMAMSLKHKVLPEELLTEKDILEMIKHTEKVRDRAMIACLAETGCRIGEIGNMKIKNVLFEGHGARLTVSGKTGMRKVLIIKSVVYLKEWINNHPKNNDPEQFLWYNTKNKSLLSYTMLVKIIKNAAKRAGIMKRIYPHLFRHFSHIYFDSYIKIMFLICIKFFFYN